MGVGEGRGRGVLIRCLPCRCRVHLIILTTTDPAHIPRYSVETRARRSFLLLAVRTEKRVNASIWVLLFRSRHTLHIYGRGGSAEGGFYRRRLIAEWQCKQPHINTEQKAYHTTPHHTRAKDTLHGARDMVQCDLQWYTNTSISIATFTIKKTRETTTTIMFPTKKAFKKNVEREREREGESWSKAVGSSWLSPRSVQQSGALTFEKNKKRRYLRLVPTCRSSQRPCPTCAQAACVPAWPSEEGKTTTKIMKNSSTREGGGRGKKKKNTTPWNIYGANINKQINKKRKKKFSDHWKHTEYEVLKSKKVLRVYRISK